MVMMAIVGRLIGKVDTRLLIGTGFALAALSLWEMSLFSLDVTPWLIVKTGVVQGLGLGRIFVPLSTVTFATLEPRFRRSEEHTSERQSLMRNSYADICLQKKIKKMCT